MRAGRPGIGGGWRPRSPSEKIQSPRPHLFAMSDCRGDTRHARPSLTPGCHGPPGYMFMQDTKPAKGQGEPEPGSQTSCSVRPPDGRPSVPRSFQKRAVPQHSNSAERQHPPQGDAGAETRPTQLHGVSIISRLSTIKSRLLRVRLLQLLILPKRWVGESRSRGGALYAIPPARWSRQGRHAHSRQASPGQ